MSGNPFVVERRPFLSPDQLERIEEAALRVLDEVGIRVLDEGLLERLRARGFRTGGGWAARSCPGGRRRQWGGRGGTAVPASL